MFIDSHCHLNFPDLISELPKHLAAMDANHVKMALVVAVDRAGLSSVLSLPKQDARFVASVGMHPDHENEAEYSVEELCSLAADEAVVAIGETGLDYYRLTGDLAWQRARFATHIQAARQIKKPLIIHTRASAEDTINMMRSEGANAIGGVMHCFTESVEVARQALDLGFYISLSGIVTFKNAVEVKEVAKFVPLDRLLIETDSPYLAPVPFRGKLNHPALVVHVAEEIATLKSISLTQVATETTNNFLRLFNVPNERKVVLQ
ncbi:TatD family hydrolase [Leeia sp. TBRC 13508]|uniref:TatD family hydrolase n=1 Tax=Leeia speluncae TaxID=2884804 RepID=A0ABS8D873_9NEIS|nr:TatD family hydrolase [Leeia speluncae]MCB6184411.1 TatD family hydrolase [Leeia speluncae]